MHPDTLKKGNELSDKIKELTTHLEGVERIVPVGHDGEIALKGYYRTSKDYVVDIILSPEFFDFPSVKASYIKGLTEHIEKLQKELDSL